MLCKRIAPTIPALLLPLSLAALASLATMGSMGCGGSNEPVVVTPEPPAPPLGSDAGIAGLSLSLGELSPAFNPNVNNYSATVGYLGETSVGVTVTLRDPKARLTINSAVTESGARAVVPLSDNNGGINAVSVVVTSEDGRVTNPVTLTIRKLLLNTNVWVLNGMGGMPVNDSVLRLTDTEGNVLAEDVPLPREKNGTAVFALDPAKKYNIYAGGTAVAQACFANFDPSREDTAALYCMRTSTTYYEREAPVIEEIAFSTANSAAGPWAVMPNSAAYEGPLANVAAVRVTMLTRNLAPVGFGTNAADYTALRINIDEVASANTGGATGATGTAVETNVPVNRGGVTYYRTTHRFTTPLLTTALFNKGHYLDVVAYDNIGNRTEQRVYLTITNSANDWGSDPDLSGVVPELFYSQSQTYIGAGDYARGGDVLGDTGVDAMDPMPGDSFYTGYHVNTIRFVVGGNYSPATVGLGIRGYEVWRSNGGQSNFVKIGTMNYATLTSYSTSPYFAFSDRTPSLVDGDVWYMVRAFNGNPRNMGFSQFSRPFKGYVLPPSTTGPSATHKAVSNKLWPEFRIAPKNPALLTEAVTDEFHFTLFIKNSHNQYPFLMVPFWVDFTETQHIQGVEPGSDIDQHRFGFELGKPTVAVRFGFTYNGNGSASNTITGGSWYYACDAEDVETEDGEETVYTPFCYLDDDGSVVVNTDSPRFQEVMQNAVRAAYASNVEPPYFVAGVPYAWNIFGNNGGLLWSTTVTRWTDAVAQTAAWFSKGYNIAPNDTTFTSIHITSNTTWGLAAAEGWFTLVIDPNAQ